MNDQLVVPPEDMEGAASAFAAASKPDIPQIEPPGSGSVSLMWGIAGEDGERLVRAEVRELNGADEEAMSRLDDKDPAYYTDLVDLVVRRATVSIGGVNVTPVNVASMTGDLLVADRELLFKQVILSTFGKERSYSGINCPFCNAENDIEVDFEGLIEVEELSGEPSLQLKLRDGRTVDIHYPRGNDQRYVYENSKTERQTPAGYNTRMIARCIDAVDGQPLSPNRALKFALDLVIADRRTLVTAIAGGPAVKFKEVEVPCTECGEAIPFAFGWADLLWV